jgi:hypothetical protein
MGRGEQVQEKDMGRSWAEMIQAMGPLVRHGLGEVRANAGA